VLFRDDEDDDPGTPGHRDHDLSEAAGYPPEEDAYGGWPTKPWFVRRWVHLLVAVVVLGSLFLPVLLRIF
jgi:hypothetical protein